MDGADDPLGSDGMLGLLGELGFAGSDDKLGLDGVLASLGFAG